MTTITLTLDDDALIALNELTKALNGLAAASGATGADDDEPTTKPAKKPAKKAAKKAVEKEGPSVEEVRKTLKEYAAIEGKAAAIEILNETGGAASVGELEEDKYQDVIDKCNETGD